MCEDVVDGVEASVATPGASPFAVDSPTSVAAEPATDEVEFGTLDMSDLAGADLPDADASGDELDALFDADDRPHALAAPPAEPDVAQISDIDRLLDLGDPLDVSAGEPGAAEGEQLLDLSDLSGGTAPADDATFGDWLEDDASKATPAEDGGKESWSWGDTDGADAPPVAKTADPVNAARKTELELKRRINELLASALVHMEQGERSEALRNLDRLLILDESNETALALKHKLMRQDGPGDVENDDDRFAPRDTQRAATAPPPPIDLDVPEAEPIDLFADAPSPSPPPHAPEPAPQRHSPRGAKGPVTGDTAGPTRRVPGLETWAALPTRSKRIYVVGLVAVVFGGLWAMNRFGGDADEPLRAVPPENPPVHAGASAGTGGVVDPRPTNGGSTSAGGGSAVTARGATSASGTGGAVAAIVASADLPTLLGQATRAMDEGEYAAAVIRYKAVLDREPANRLAARGLIDAGEAYRQQQEMQRQERAAREAFVEGDYHTALRAFYRVPAGTDDERLGRWKFNGWYNLTAGALRTSNCRSASDALTELRGLDARHAAVPQLDRLVAQCGSSAPAGWRGEVERLADRDLDD